MLKKYSFLFLSLLIIWTPLSLIALGYKFNLSLLTANYYLFFLVLYLILRKYFAILFFLHSIVCTLYLPVGLTWGTLNAAMMDSMARTNLQETIEFISQFPSNYLIYSGLFFVFSCFLTYLCCKNKNLDYKKFNKISLSFIFFAIFVFLAKIFLEPLITDAKLELYYLVNNNPYSKFYKIAAVKYEEISILKQALAYKDNFQIIETKPKYKNYVLVIGESMRNDYTSLYGYPIDTTPFLRTVKGKIYDGFVSPSANTPTALTRILFWNKFGGKYKTHNQENIGVEDDNFKIFDNIINLAKKANYKTIWLSNHSERGEVDFATTSIAKICDEDYFSIGNLAKLYMTRYVFDSKLLPILKTKIISNKNNNKTNLYILHIIGSHEPFCQRLEKNETLIYKTPEENFSCYLHSITKTDDFLRDLDKLLKEEFKKDYSVLYFSDHGLSHFKKTYHMRHFVEYQQNYESPLVIFNGDDTTQKRIKVKKSGYNFIFAFAEWLGIREKNLEAENYTFFNDIDDKDIKVYNWNEDVNFDDLPRDIRFVDGVEKIEN